MMQDWIYQKLAVNMVTSIKGLESDLIGGNAEFDRVIRPLLRP